MKTLPRFAAWMLIAVALNACSGSLYYTSDPIEAWVVDAETGKPIEGAVVTANWQLVAMSFDSARKLRQLAVMETTTDKNGRFFFSGFTKLNLTLDELREEDPQILIFKSGYRYFRTSNAYSIGKDAPGPHRSSSIIGQTLMLNKADSDVRKVAFELGFLTTNIMNITESGGATSTATMLHALACERMRLKQIDPSLILSVPGAVGLEVKCEQ